MTSRSQSPAGSAEPAGGADPKASAGAADAPAPEHAAARGDRLRLLRFRSRRGLLELELLLLPFAAGRLEALEPDALDAYERLLACEDLDVYDWLQGRSAPPDRSLEAIVREVARYNAATPRS